MNIVAQHLLSRAEEYVVTMELQGRRPMAIYLTAQQHQKIIEGLRKDASNNGATDDEVAEIRLDELHGIPVSVVNDE